MALKPLLQALVLADHVYIDKQTGKKIIAGTFNHLTADEFPSQFSRNCFAFLSMTDVRGKTSIDLRFVDLSTQQTLLELSDLEVSASDPLATVEMVVEAPKFPMPHEGAFAFEAYANGELMGSLRLFISRRRDDDEDG